MTNNEQLQESDTEQQIDFFSIKMDGVKNFITSMQKISDEKNIRFEHPYKISFADDWMASGVILDWNPMISDGEKAYHAQLVFIIENNSKNTKLFELKCIRCLIHQNRAQSNYELKYIKECKDFNNDFITPEQAFETFVELNKLEEALKLNLHSSIYGEQQTKKI